MKPGQLLDIQGNLRAYDDSHATYWVQGPILVLDSNEYDITYLCGHHVLYSSCQEVAVELELGALCNVS